MTSRAFGGKALGLTVALHAACLALATYPSVLSLGSTIPDQADTMAEIFVLRWYRICLAEGRSIFFLPDLQFPVGVPFGNYSPLHAQTLLSLPLWFALHNEALVFNLICVFGLLLTGLGTTLLIDRVIEDRPCAAFGGVLAMLSAPMLCHAQRGHSELLFLGSIPLFLIVWMTFVDRPGRRSLALAALAYVAVAMSAAYYMVFAIFPAVLYLAWEGAKARSWPWVRGRIPWLLGMVGLTLPCLVVLFISHIWAILHGFSMERPRDEFDSYAVSLLSYLSPSGQNALHAFLPARPTPMDTDSPTYPGVVSIALLLAAAVLRVKRVGFWWLALALMVVLSLGSTATLGSWRISLPAAWLWKVFPPIRLTRVPSRFSLLAAVFAALIASAALRTLLAKIPSARWRGLVLGVLTLAAVADLGNVPFSRVRVPELPGCYAFIRQHNPKAKLLEVPTSGSGGSILNLTCLYWQSHHRLTTSAGSSGRHNDQLDRTLTDTSPFLAHRLADPGYLANPAKLNLDLTTDLDFTGYLWAYLTFHGFDYVVLHQWEGAFPDDSTRGPATPAPDRLARVKTLLKDGRVYEDAETVVYARDRLVAPTRPLSLGSSSWPIREIWQERWSSTLKSAGTFVIYNPEAEADIALQLDSAAVEAGQTVELRAGTRVLACWDVGPEGYQSKYTPPFRLPAGFHELTLTSEPSAGSTVGGESDRLRVARMVVIPASWLGPIAVRPGRESLLRR